MTCTQCGAALTAADVFYNKCGSHAAANLPAPADPLRAEAAHDTLAVTEISGQIKARCTEIGAHVRAAETVRVETS